MEISDYLRFVLALVFVLALIGVLAMVARRFGLGSIATATGKQRRLSLVEAMSLDSKRRVVLIRRDDVEHLLVLGPNSETVVETDIAAPPSPPAADKTRGTKEPSQ